MTIGELKEELKNLPDDMKIFLQTDPEGNGYYNLRGIDIDGFIMIQDMDEYMPDIYHFSDTKDYEEDTFVQVAVVFP